MLSEAKNGSEKCWLVVGIFFLDFNRGALFTCLIEKEIEVLLDTTGFSAVRINAAFLISVYTRVSLRNCMYKIIVVL